MSAIGRVFIVLNLVLAGAFVGFAGTFLQKHTDYKAQFEASQDELAGANDMHTKQLAAKDDALRQADRELRAHKAQLDAAENSNKGLEEENQRLNGQLAELATDVKNLSSQTTTMAQAITQAREDSKQAYEMAMAAVREKDEALTAKEEAQTAASESQRRISDLEDSVAERNATIAMLEQQNDQKEVLLAMVKRKVPGVLATLQPDLRGTVTNVGPAGELVTVQITDNPGAVAVEAGYSMAIYRDGYKGEAVIQGVTEDGQFAFCRMTKQVTGSMIQVGDNAATNLGQ